MPPQRRNAGFVPPFFLRRRGGLRALPRSGELRFGANSPQRVRRDVTSEDETQVISRVANFLNGVVCLTDARERKLLTCVGLALVLPPSVSYLRPIFMNLWSEFAKQVVLR